MLRDGSRSAEWESQEPRSQRLSRLFPEHFALVTRDVEAPSITPAAGATRGCLPPFTKGALGGAVVIPAADTDVRGALRGAR